MFPRDSFKRFFLIIINGLVVGVFFWKRLIHSKYIRASETNFFVSYQIRSIFSADLYNTRSYWCEIILYLFCIYKTWWNYHQKFDRNLNEIFAKNSSSYWFNILNYKNFMEIWQYLKKILKKHCYVVLQEVLGSLCWKSN